MKIKVASFYMENISEQMIIYQKKVFDHLGVSLDQIKIEKDHGWGITRYVWGLEGDYDTLVLFDIDAIPLTKEAVPWMIETVSDGKTLLGHAQCSNHIHKDKPRLYASCAIMAFSRQFYETIGMPSFQYTHDGDTSSELTYRTEMIANGHFGGKPMDLKVKYMWPTSTMIPMWTLGLHGVFGIGTTFDRKVFHLFQGSVPKHLPLFVKKCQEVLGESE